MTARVVCVGLATLDTVVEAPRRPEADDRVVASQLVVAGGGPAATAAVTLARLGVDTAFVGTVGDDDVADRIRAGLESEGVDVTHVKGVPGARSPQSVVVVVGGGRAIHAFPGTMPLLELDDAALEACRRAAWVHADHVGYRAVPRDVRLSIDGGNPIDDLDVGGVALYAPTETALQAQLGSAQRALDEGAELVVVTGGERGSVAYRRDGAVVECPAYPVEVVSTLGAGDVFHGALLAQLVRDADLEDALAYANRCAALSCRALDGRSGIPTRAELEAA